MKSKLKFNEHLLYTEGPRGSKPIWVGSFIELDLIKHPWAPYRIRNRIGETFWLPAWAIKIPDRRLNEKDLSNNY